MATNLDGLSNNQLIQVDNAVDIGNELGLSDVLIETAVLIANAESDFNPNAAANTTSASGLYQYDSFPRSRVGMHT